MRMVSLQSGSNGNCIFVESKGVRLLFDAGLSGAKTAERLKDINIDIGSIQGVVISHDHADHISCAGVLHRKFGLPIWMTMKTYDRAVAGKRLGRICEPKIFSAGQCIDFGKLAVETVPTTHDAADGVGFVIDDGSSRLGVMTDLGHVFTSLPSVVATLDGILIESNYDLKMLSTGSYPDHLKRRIRGYGGHLSNVEAAQLLKKAGGKLRWACLGHISQENNHHELVLETHRQILGNRLHLFLASRHGLSESLDL